MSCWVTSRQPLGPISCPMRALVPSIPSAVASAMHTTLPNLRPLQGLQGDLGTALHHRVGVRRGLFREEVAVPDEQGPAVRLLRDVHRGVVVLIGAADYRPDETAIVVVEGDETLSQDRAGEERDDARVALEVRVGGESRDQPAMQCPEVPDRVPDLLGARVDDGLLAYGCHSAPSFGCRCGVLVRQLRPSPCGRVKPPPLDPPPGGASIMRAMTTLVTIGDFSRMSYLSVKALRHYHETGLLEPAQVDPDSGYRLYDATQVSTAQVIRRFRELGMPIEQVRAVLDAPDIETRNRIVTAHLERMESQLEDTRRTVGSLRKLLERAGGEVAVEFRSVPATRAIAIAEPVRRSEAEEWWGDAFAELFGALETAGLERSGPPGALYSGNFFQDDEGEVTAFVPVPGSTPAGGPGHSEIPGGEFAVTVHEGSFADLDQTYAALGTWVADRAIGLDGAIREHYVVSSLDTGDEAEHRTEVCWPVFHTGRPPEGA